VTELAELVVRNDRLVDGSAFEHPEDDGSASLSVSDVLRTKDGSRR
jgi:hypothetical protein